MRRAWLAGVLALLCPTVVAAPPRVEIGDLALTVTATARRLELDGNGEPAPRIVIACRLSAARAGVVDHVLDATRGATLTTADGRAWPLVRVNRRTADAEASEFDLVFAGAPEAGTVVTLRGAVVHYQKRRDFLVEVSDLAQPVGATGTVGDITLRVTWLSPARVGDERRWYFSGRVERRAPADNGPVQWSEDRLDLLDADGTRWPAIGLRVLHGDEGETNVAHLDGFFPLPETTRPAVLRYQCARYEGVTVSAYEFTGLPLP